MSWEQLIWFAAAATLCWVTGAVLAFRSKQTWPAATASLMGSMIFFAYIVVCGLLWSDLLCERWARRACGTRSSSR